MDMLDYVIGVAIRLGHWGYLVIAFGAMLESAAFLGLLVPGESLVLVAGFIAGQGVFDLDVLIIAVAVGAALGDSIGYELGRRFGRPWAQRHGGRFGLTEARLKRAEGFFDRHGGKSVFLGRFVGFARALVPFVAGSTRMPYLHFLGFNLLGASLWAVLTVLIGYLVGRAATQWMGRASAVLGGILLVVLVSAWLWHWLADHEAEVRAWWARVRMHPRVAALLRRFSPQIGWLRDRLSPGGYLGLQITLGVLVFVGAVWLFGGIAEDVVHGDPLTLWDRRIALWFHAHQNPAMTRFMLGVSRFHGWGVIAVAALLFFLYVLWMHLWRWALATLFILSGGMLLNTLLNLVFHRAHPGLTELAATLGTYSFPSGQSMAATVFWGTLAAFLATRLEAWRWRVLVVVAAFFLVLLAGLSNVYLGVHFFSDVVAAIAEGVGWMALCFTALNTYWQRRARRR